MAARGDVTDEREDERAGAPPGGIEAALDAAEREDAPSFAELVGGPVGLAEASLPGVAFVVAYSASGSDTELSVTVAVGVALAIAAGRLIRRQTPRHALSGLVGIGIAAFVATRSGRAEDFYLPGLLTNAAYAAAFIVSNLIRHPLVGVIVGALDGEHGGWREDPVRVKAFRRATWFWAGLFLLRLVVQLPLYLAGEVVVLGILRTAMGLPLFALGIYLTFLMVRRHHPGGAAP